MRVLLLADIHGNIDALNAVVGDASGYDYLVFLGDIVNYGPNPAEVIDRLKELRPDAWLQGDHDRGVASGRSRLSVGYGLRSVAEHMRRITSRMLSRSDKIFLKNLQPITRLEVGDHIIILAHASPRDPLHGGISPWFNEERILKELRPAGIPLEKSLQEATSIITGHTHRCMATRVRNILVLNPGSAGCPGDGDPRPSYAILDIRRAEVTFRRVKYPVHKVLERLEKLVGRSGVYNVLREILLTGRHPA